MSWISHEEFGLELARLLKRRLYADAISLWGWAKPFSQMSMPSVESLAALMETDPPCLAFLRSHERDDVQIAAGFAYCVGATRRMARFLNPKLTWPHQLSKDAAVHNLIAAWHADQVIHDLEGISDTLGLRVRVQNSCEGACITCLLASSIDYALDHFPPVPIVGCVNYEAGCRCSLMIAEPQSRHQLVSWPLDDLEES